MGEPNEEPLAEDPEEAGGGPVKSFLEHLEDLRWLIIKCAAALAVCFVGCLYANDRLVTILSWPLKQAALVRQKDSKKVIFRYGENTLASYDTKSNSLGGLQLGSNWLTVVQVEPLEQDGKIFLTARVDPNPPEEAVLDSATQLVYIDPSAPFLSSMQLAFYGGILLASPFIFFFLAQFILPALRIREKKYALRAGAVGVGLFLGGVGFCYFFVMARALKFAEWWALWMGVKVPEWRAETYFSFVTKFMLGMGLGFELPVVILALVKIGLLDYRKLVALRRYMIVINLVLGALLTTPEVFTQVVMAIVLQLLFEISVWIAWYWDQPDRAKARRRMLLVIVTILLSAGLIWVAFQSGRLRWPWAH